MTKDIDHISKKEFIAKLESYRKGSITRRHFLNVTGLGAATAVLGAVIAPCQVPGAEEQAT